jgi:protein O-GlcNAc transferase
MQKDNTVTEERFREENIHAEEAISANNLPEAARILVDIVQNDPENWRAYNNMGIISWAQEYWNDAYTMFLKSVSLRPDYTDALVNLFDAALKLRKISEVLPCFEHASSLNPDVEEITILRDSIREQGEDIYTSRRALAIGMYSPLVDEARKELDSGNLYKAMDLFLKANDKDGPNAAAFCGLGIISYYQERFEDAFVLFIESIKLNPTDKDTFLNLFDAAKACNRMGEAKTVLETYSKELPELNDLKHYFSDETKKD